MALHDVAGGTHHRRRVLAGMGGAGIVALSGVPLTGAADVEVISREYDPYTLDTYRAIVDAIVPETPELGDELGETHVPGGLAVSLEEFLVYDLDHFQEVQAESVTGDDWLAIDEALLVEHVDSVLNTLASGTRRSLELLGVEGADDVFGDFEAANTEIVGSNPNTGAARVEVTVETTDATVTRVTENYPYSLLLAVIFDLVAVEFVARSDDVEVLETAEFPAGGLFTRLSRRDRLRALESIVDGGILDDVDATVGALVPTVGILQFAVMAILGLTAIGHYSEWAGYGETGIEPPNERELAVPQGEVLGHRQTGFPGLEPGYAADRGVPVDSFVENEWESHFADDDGDFEDGDTDQGDLNWFWGWF